METPADLLTMEQTHAYTGLYFVLGLLFLFLVSREIAHGPVPLDAGGVIGGAHGEVSHG